ncbi:hypothetical protein [Ruegeria atlantica]|uniref:hypothetical protein n=1 Tax=Ruegeria atlantica TaxID=81569 RepID=UPI000AA202D4|nr:hypothetical protein [Ruegeria atlantica]
MARVSQKNISELDYLRLRLAEARKEETLRRKAEVKCIAVVVDYERQLAEHGNDEAAVRTTVGALGISPNSVYRTRKALGTQTVVNIGTGLQRQNKYQTDYPSFTPPKPTVNRPMNQKGRWEFKAAGLSTYLERFGRKAETLIPLNKVICDQYTLKAI